MELIAIQDILKQRVRTAAATVFGAELDQIAAEIPPKTAMGDFAFPIAFELARSLKQKTGEKQNPREIAAALKKELDAIGFVERVEIAGAGYLNVYLDRGRLLFGGDPDPKAEQAAPTPAEPAKKICVEHTSVNPNKAAHIGHVRNAVIGDTFVRILRAAGHRVEVQNYIDNTGVQVADVVVGFLYIEKLDLAGVRELDRRLAAGGRTFDYYCWDLYAAVGKAYLEDDELKAKRAEVLHAVELGGNATADLAEFVGTRNVECILETMQRFSIEYDLLPRESEILHLKFWQKAFYQMKRRSAIRLEAEGKNAGCWVMPFESHAGTDEHDADKILVRSNGTVTYTGKDIAYQMWKLGLLGLDFYYRKFYRYADGHEVWMTSSVPIVESGDAPSFGGGDVVYNVIDARQSYTQDVVRKAVGIIYPERGEAASVHLSYEMVALSPAAADELGFPVSDEDRGRPFVEMSGRKGLGVKADDLLARLEANARLEVEARHPDADAESKTLIARQIAVGALRYFLLKFSRTTVIVFDFKEALAFEGETGCFCQYSAVRANSIFRKLADAGLSVNAAAETAKADVSGVADVLASAAGDEIWSLLLLAMRFGEAVENAAVQNEPAVLAKYAFNLARAFNLFYHNHRIVAETDRTKQAVLIMIADRARSALTEALATMGIDVPERM